MGKYADNEAVTIAKVDCTAEGNTNKELCDGQDVKGFPTLNIYKDGKKITEYNGKRGLVCLPLALEGFGLSVFGVVLWPFSRPVTISYLGAIVTNYVDHNYNRKKPH